MQAREGPLLSPGTTCLQTRYMSPATLKKAALYSHFTEEEIMTKKPRLFVEFLNPTLRVAREPPVRGCELATPSVDGSLPFHVISGKNKKLINSGCVLAPVIHFTGLQSINVLQQLSWARGFLTSFLKHWNKGCLTGQPNTVGRERPCLQEGAEAPGRLPGFFSKEPWSWNRADLGRILVVENHVTLGQLLNL